MKKLFAVILLLICGIYGVKGQEIIYQSPQQQRSSQQQQSQSTRTTAYYADNSGRITKIPIRVQLQRNAWGVEGYYVTEYYTDSGIGGRWNKITPASQIYKCNSLLSSNPLEKQFMYRATVNLKTCYFDL